MAGWAVDFGTTNSGLARWDPVARRADILELPALCRAPGGDRILEAPRMVPSAAELLPPDLWSRIGRLPVVRSFDLGGPSAIIGQPALQRNDPLPGPAFARSFKSALLAEPGRAVAHLGRQRLTARDVARAYLRELVRAARVATGEPIRELVFSVPVDSYDGYRAELRATASMAGVRRARFVDEPVAAAMGYGLSIERARRVLVVDIGGGTLHVAVAELSGRDAEQGVARVLAKQGHAVGGDRVDEWLLADVLRLLGLHEDPDATGGDDHIWRRVMLEEARRVKEALHFEGEARFTLVAPAELRGVAARLGDTPHSAVVTREQLRAVLRSAGLYQLLEQGVSGVVEAAGGEVDDVLMVGGSTLLPGVFGVLEARFGRDRVRGWTPFEAVVTGAAVFAGGDWAQSDTIVHDYAILTHDAATQARQYHVIVPSGTRYPTERPVWRQQLVPTCGLGVPETLFKLELFEIGRGAGGQRFAWDRAGSLVSLTGADAEVVVPLNEANPALGRLDPPHLPGDRSPRLDVAFGVSADRWLVADVVDLKTGRALMKAEPVVRLM